MNKLDITVIWYDTAVVCWVI